MRQIVLDRNGEFVHGEQRERVGPVLLHRDVSTSSSSHAIPLPFLPLSAPAPRLSSSLSSAFCLLRSPFSPHLCLAHLLLRELPVVHTSPIGVKPVLSQRRHEAGDECVPRSPAVGYQVSSKHVPTPLLLLNTGMNNQTSVVTIMC